MSRLVRLLIAVALVANVAGCCASPYRMYQSAYGFNNPRPEGYIHGPLPPKITPPGVSKSARVIYNPD